MSNKEDLVLKNLIQFKNDIGKALSRLENIIIGKNVEQNSKTLKDKILNRLNSIGVDKNGSN